MGLRDRLKRNKGSGGGNSGGSLSDAQRFKNLYSGFVGPNGKMGQAEFSTLMGFLAEWQLKTPNDLNLHLALIMLKAPSNSPSTVRSQVSQAKSQYSAIDPSMTSWFENLINKRI